MEYKMKDSGIPWIGEIPEHWEVKRLKFSCKIFGRIGFRGYKSDDLVTEGNGAITLSPSNMQDMNMDYTKRTYLSWEKYFESPEIMIKNSDVIMVKTGSTYGKCSYVTNLPMECTINPQIVVLKEHIDCSKFLAYSFQTPSTKAFIETSVVGGTIPTISQEKILNYSFVFPSLMEQLHIVSLLDKKCDEIDKLILLQEKMIADLQAYKQAVITESVTKGLDKNVKMKDSGIEWIGEIPEHWIYKRFKYAGKFVKGNLPQSTNIENLGSPIIGASEMLGKECRLFTDDISLPTCNLDDVIILWDGANAGIVASNLKGIISSTVVKYSCDDPCVHKRYLFYLMKSYERYFKTKVCGTTIPHMNISFINDVPLLVPIYFEQQQIAEYLDKKCDDIDKLILLKKQKIEELKECKKSVIFEYVTGKKQVKNLSGRR